MSKINKMHAPVSQNQKLVPIKDIPFPLRNRLIHEKKMHASYHELRNTRNDLTDLRVVTSVLKAKIEKQEQLLQKVEEYEATLKERRAAFLPDPAGHGFYLLHEGPLTEQICQKYIVKWKEEMEQAKRKPINPHLWNAPMVLWFLFCLGLHGYGVYVAETSKTDMVINMDLITVVANSTDEKEVEELCRNASDWVLVLSCFLIAASSLCMLSYYVVYPLRPNGWFCKSSYESYSRRYSDHVDGITFVCLPLHVLLLCPWMIYGFVLFFNPLAVACPTELYYYGFVYSIFPGTVFVLLCFLAILLPLCSIAMEQRYWRQNQMEQRRLMLLFGGLVLIAFVVLYVWFFVHVVEVGEKNLARNTLVLNNQTESTSSLALAQACAEGAQYLIDSGLTTLIYSVILLFFGIVVSIIVESNINGSRRYYYEDRKIKASCCMNVLLFGRFIIEVVFAILGGVLFFNSERYACGAELFGFGLGMTIVFIFSSLSTCNACSTAQPSKKN